MTKIIEPTKCNTRISAGGGDCATCEPETSPEKEYAINDEHMYRIYLHGYNHKAWETCKEVQEVRSRPAPTTTAPDCFNDVSGDGICEHAADPENDGESLVCTIIGTNCNRQEIVDARPSFHQTYCASSQRDTAIIAKAKAEGFKEGYEEGEAIGKAWCESHHEEMLFTERERVLGIIKRYCLVRSSTCGLVKQLCYDAVISKIEAIQNGEQ